MLKKLLFLPLFLLNLQLVAMEEKHVVHTPQVKAEIAKSIEAHIEAKNTSFGDDVLKGTGMGGFAPWALSGLLGYGAIKGFYFMLGAKGGNGSDVEGVGAGLGCFLFSIPNLILTLPCAAVGTLGGLAYGTYNEIAEAVNDPEKRRLIALYMYQWISVVKEGRLNIRAELQKQISNGSLKATVESMLSDDETFKRYFGETNFTKEELKEHLSKVDATQDNYNGLFQALSNIMKTPKLTDDEWQKLENALINFKNKDKEFPKITPEDIKEYLYVSVYYFALQKGGVKWLKFLIQ